ncbi:MAG: nitroreductase family protein [Ilumatobacter fluminis]|uniref:nitroreductase family protein n=1 Tax=Ilumatobacter fluminis TaxID=467091 RepID=UPI0032EF3EB2
MLEKGLVMRPRRAVFALEYIGATVDALGRLAQDDSVSEGELAWPRAVLQTYFEVVGEDDSGTIRNAKERFEAVCSSGTFAPHPGAVSSVPYSQGTLDRSPVTPEAFVGLAQQRRSVRWFDGAPVPREVIDRAIEVGALAPSACNRQPFRFIVTTDAATVAQLIDLPLGTRGYGHQVPGLIVAVGNLSAFYSERDRHLIYIDASMAIMQMALAFETEGVSTCCINWPDIAERERLARRVLELERWEQIVMFVAFGYADPTGGVPYSAKRPLDELRSYLGHSHVEEVPSHGRH